MYLSFFSSAVLIIHRLRHCGSSGLTNLDFIIHRLRQYFNTLALHYSTVTAGLREQEISAIQSGLGILQSLREFNKYIVLPLENQCY